MNPDEIKAFRKHRKMSQEQLGQLCGVTKATVSKWEKGQRNPSGSALIQLDRLFNDEISHLPLGDLEHKLLDECVRLGGFDSREDFLTESLKHFIHYGGLLEPDTREASLHLDEVRQCELPDIANNKVTHLHLVDPPSDEEDEQEESYSLPLLGAVAAGSAISGDPMDEVTVSKAYPADCYALRVMGDSMDDGSSTAIPDGSLAIIKAMPEGQPYAAKNRIYAWNLDDGQVLKKFVRRKVDGKTRGFLESLNPAYPPVPYTSDMTPQGEFICVD